MTRTIGRKAWDKTYRPRDEAGSYRLNGVHVGFVKDNQDPQKMGRLRVYIPEYGGKPDEENTWLTVSYASPFAGCTSFLDLKQNGQDMASSSTSYGWWAEPPDLDNQVLVTFANGDPSRGFWFACLYQQNMNHMVPGVPSNVPTDPSMQPPKGIEGALPPVVEYNRWSTDVNPDSPRRPVFTPLHEALLAQGLYPDKERGPASSGARRESPSRVYGYLTPNSHTIHVDENPNNEFIRMRTRNGTQVLIHDSTGYVYINSKSGNSWLEVSDLGIDAYTEGSYSLRASTDVNIHADRDIFMNAKGAIGLTAGTSILLNSGQNTEIAVGASLHTSAAGNITNNAGANILNTAASSIASDAGGNITEKAGGLNIRTASNIYDNSSTAAPAAGAPQASTRGSNLFLDPLTGSISSIVNRLPTHEPWYGHPKSAYTGPPVGEPEGNGVVEGGNGIVTNPQNNVQTGSGDDQPVNLPPDTSAVSKACNNVSISDNVKNAIKSAASQVGVDKDLMFAIAHRESHFKTTVIAGKNGKQATAGGLFQITNGTWNGIVSKYGSQYSLDTNGKLDARNNAMGGALLIRDSTTALQKAGVQTGPTQVYMCMFLGSSNAVKFLRAYSANPNAPADQNQPLAAQYNRSIFYDSSGRARSLADVYNQIAQIVPLYNCYKKLNL